MVIQGYLDHPLWSRDIIKAITSCVQFAQQKLGGRGFLTPPESQYSPSAPVYLYDVRASLSDLSYGMEAKKEFRSWQLMKNTMSSTNRKSSRHMTM